MQPDSDLLTLRESELDLMLQLLHRARAEKQQTEQLAPEARAARERSDPDAPPPAQYDPYTDQLPPGADVPDSFIPEEDASSRDAGRSKPSNDSVDSDLVVDGPEDSPETSYDDLRFAEHCVDNKFLERNT